MALSSPRQEGPDLPVSPLTEKAANAVITRQTAVSVSIVLALVIAAFHTGSYARSLKEAIDGLTKAQRANTAVLEQLAADKLDRKDLLMASDAHAREWRGAFRLWVHQASEVLGVSLPEFDPPQFGSSLDRQK